jgi:hypothetical protein
MSIEAMKQALDALGCIDSALHVREINKIGEAMKALRQAIAEAEKPWVKSYAGGKPNYTTRQESRQVAKNATTGNQKVAKSATTEWVGLTDEERAECWNTSAVQSALNIEAKLKEKNHG